MFVLKDFENAVPMKGAVSRT